VRGIRSNSQPEMPHLLVHVSSKPQAKESKAALAG
jgi:hypothetical protein